MLRSISLRLAACSSSTSASSSVTRQGFRTSTVRCPAISAKPGEQIEDQMNANDGECRVGFTQTRIVMRRHKARNGCDVVRECPGPYCHHAMSCVCRSIVRPVRAALTRNKTRWKCLCRKLTRSDSTSFRSDILVCMRQERSA